MIEAVVVVGLTSLYITYTVRYLEGPFDLYHWILSWVGIERIPMLDNDGDTLEIIEEVTTPKKFVTKVVQCFWCFTTWISLVATIVYCLLSSLNVGQCIFVWLASAGLSGWLFERIPDGTSK